MAETPQVKEAQPIYKEMGTAVAERLLQEAKSTKSAETWIHTFEAAFGKEAMAKLNRELDDKIQKTTESLPTAYKEKFLYLSSFRDTRYGMSEMQSTLMLGLDRDGLYRQNLEFAQRVDILTRFLGKMDYYHYLLSIKGGASRTKSQVSTLKNDVEAGLEGTVHQDMYETNKEFIVKDLNKIRDYFAKKHPENKDLLESLDWQIKHVGVDGYVPSWYTSEGTSLGENTESLITKILEE